MNLKEFRNIYGTDTKCLDFVCKSKYPNCFVCGKKLYRVKNRPVYTCMNSHQISPLVGTVFEKSSTPLSSWFFAMFLMSSTRSGVSAKMLERVLGVTYKTAWRMFKQIRLLMSENMEPLKGEVEVDETWIGGKNWFRGKKWWSNYKERPNTMLLGMVERNGKVKVAHIYDRDWKTLTSQIKFNVQEGSRVITDGWMGYNMLKKADYTHNSVNHMVHYVDNNDPTIHTQNIESFWGQMKRGITGTYRSVSRDYLMFYVNEYAFRHNHKEDVFGSMVKNITVEDIPF